MFLNVQWRNVRQRKRGRLDSGESHDELDASDDNLNCTQTQPSQTHSLYSAKLGHVPITRPSSIQLEEPETVQLSASQPHDINVSVSKKSGSGAAHDSGTTLSSGAALSAGTARGTRTARGNSTARGNGTAHDNVTAHKRGALAKGSGSTVAGDSGSSEAGGGGSTEAGGGNVSAPEDVDLPDIRDHRNNDDDDDFEEPREEPLIRLNPKANKTGRPVTNRKAREAAVRADRVRFNATQQLRRSFGDVSLEMVVASLDRERQTPARTLARAEAVPTRFTEHANKRPQLKKMANPVLNADAFYILPIKLLSACMKLLPVANCSSSPIQVDGDTSTSTESAEIEVLAIPGVGMFSRSQIEAMQRLITIRTVCEECAVFCSWLEQDVIAAVDAGEQKRVRELAVHVSCTYPDSIVHGFPTEHRYSMLYRLAPPRWLCDSLIGAFCERLTQRYSSVRFCGIASATTRRPRDAQHTADPVLSDRVAEQAAGDGVKSVVVPVNFGNQHWCALTVDVGSRRVIYYDSMNSTSYVRALDGLAWDIARRFTGDYAVVSTNSPIQFDGFSCGVFACMKIWSFVDSTMGKELAALSLTAVRYRIAAFILDGVEKAQ